MRTGLSQRAGGSRRWVVVALAVTLIVVAVAAIFASSDPDGLERVATDLGFSAAGEGSPFSIIADYVFPGLEGPLATIVAGVIGVGVLFALLWLVGRALARRRPPEA